MTSSGIMTSRSSVISFVIILYLTHCCAGKRNLQIADITKLHISSDVRFRYSVTTIESHVNNYNAVAKEVVFRVTLPRQAFISRFSMTIDNVTYPGHVKEKAAANAEYEAAKSKGQSSGIVRQKPRDSNVFAVSVNVAAKGEIDFTLVYEELLTRKLGKYEQTINVDPGQIVFDLRVRVSIDESRPLAWVRAPPLRTGNEIAVVEDEAKNELAVVERLSESQAVISYNPTKSDQKAMGEKGISGQFLVEYDVDHATAGGEVQVVDGYFVHFFAPKDLPPLYKHVYFVLDVSGSMSGRKIEQMRDAMLVILDDLKEGDQFTIMKFSTGLEIWTVEKEQTHAVVPSKIFFAKSFIKSLRAEGGTNIYDSLEKALEDMKKSSEVLSNAIESDSHPFHRANVIIFLTDGQPNEGRITGTNEIVSEISKKNVDQSVLFYSLGFGNDVDFKFLERLSLRNGGFARKIYESSDSALQLVGFYKEISSPLIADLDFVYFDQEVQTDSITKTTYKIYYEGTEIVIAGRLNGALEPPFSISSTINGTESNGSLSYFCTLEPEPSPTPEKSGGGYLERLWAYLTIQQLLEKKSSLSATESADDIAAIDARVLELALEYEFVTSLTSMVVTKPPLREIGGGTANETAVIGEEEEENEEMDEGLYAMSASMGGAPSLYGGGGGGRLSSLARPASAANAPNYYDYESDDDYDDYYALSGPSSLNKGSYKVILHSASLPNSASRYSSFLCLLFCLINSSIALFV